MWWWLGVWGEFDRNDEAIVKKSLSSYESKLEFTYLTDLTMPTLLERLKHLPSKTVVIHTSLMEDAAGAHFIDANQSLPMVVRAANAPVFVLEDVDFGSGAVGGNVLSWAATGQIAASMALKILNGERPEGISIVKSANVYMFDWRALRRWGLKESNLPPGQCLPLSAAECLGTVQGVHHCWHFSDLGGGAADFRTAVAASETEKSGSRTRHYQRAASSGRGGGEGGGMGLGHRERSGSLVW